MSIRSAFAHLAMLERSSKAEEEKRKQQIETCYHQRRGETRRKEEAALPPTKFGQLMGNEKDEFLGMASRMGLLPPWEEVDVEQEASSQSATWSAAAEKFAPFEDIALGWARAWAYKAKRLKNNDYSKAPATKGTTNRDAKWKARKLDTSQAGPTGPAGGGGGKQKHSTGTSRKSRQKARKRDKRTAAKSRH